jgi:hypothetical protein
MRAGWRAHSTSTSNRRHAAVAPQQCGGRRWRATAPRPFAAVPGAVTVIARSSLRFPLTARHGCCSPRLIFLLCARWELLVPVGSGRCRRGGGARSRRPARGHGRRPPRARFVFARREGECMRAGARGWSLRVGSPFTLLSLSLHTHNHPLSQRMGAALRGWLRCACCWRWPAQ